MLRLETPPCCPVPPHPRLPEIRAGLSVLPRQLTGFPDYRRAMLAAVPTKEALDGWTADGADDLGVMLIEAFAYVLDIAGFYDMLIAGRSYVGTALDDQVMREIVALIGYVPRPAMVSRVLLALEAQGEDKVTAATATGFRSQAFGVEPPQIFELLAPADVWPQRNKWTLAPWRQSVFDGILRFLPGEGPSVGTVVALTGSTSRFVGRVASVETSTEADGLKYQIVRFETWQPTFLAGVYLSTLNAASLTLRAGISPLAASPLSLSGGSGTAILDSLYPHIGRSTVAALEIDGAVQPAWITAVSTYTHELKDSTSKVLGSIPLTKIEFNAVGTIPANASVFFHLVPRPLGRPTRVAETGITLAMMQPTAALQKPVKPLNGAPSSGKAIAAGAKDQGALVPGSVTIAADGRASFQPDAGAAAFAEPLVIPVNLFGNVVEAVRGETVVQEQLGSADASVAGQRFKLRKKPLSWIEDASRTLGRAPQLNVRVDGLAWTYVESFYGRGPEERIYRVEMALDGTATIVFGDGVRGARPDSGISNVTAGYRVGAGAAKPPAGSIRQFAKPAKGLARVSGPLSGFGGADAESAAELRTAAPTAMLSLGRAVSTADFEAMARAYSGVANAAVAYSWDPARHEATIMVWTISDSGDVSAALGDYLRARAVPGLAIRAAPAVAVAVPVFDVHVVAAEGYDPAAVRDAVRQALFDPSAGLLGPSRIAISAPLFRSHLLAAIHAVTGVREVRSIMIQSGEMPKAMTLAEGQWFDFLSHGQVL
jgi:predicted phage baseplate assembly protein